MRDTIYQLILLSLISATVAGGSWVVYLITASTYQFLYAAGGF